MDYAIRTAGMTRTFGAITAVADVTFDVAYGEVFGLLGHNGAGKTTTIRLLNGVLTPTRGEASVLGLVPARDGAALRARTGVLTETPAIDERLTGRENLRFAARLWGVPAAQVDTRADEVLAQLGLADRGDERAGRYSKGMKQRLALARALVHKPELLYLDEPTAGLDPVAARDVLSLVRAMVAQNRTTVIICTHNLFEAQRSCDRVAVMQKGVLLAVGTPAELAERSGLPAQLELEVAAAQMSAAAELARRFAQGEVTADGNGSIRLALPKTRVPALVAALVNADIQVFEVATREPSLEDVYFGLTGESHA